MRVRPVLRWCAQLDFWNRYDYIVISLTFCSLLSRLVSVPIAVDVLSFNVILVWCRLFKYLSISREIGLLVIMIVAMMTDIFLWTLVSMVFLGAFTVAFISISDTSFIDQGGDHPVTVPLWATLGFFDVHEVHQWNPEVGQAMLFMYVVVSNVILVNLLIAMMGHTFGVIKERADEEWKYGRLASVLEATERMNPMPPPFNLPVTLGHFIKTEVLGMHNESARTAQEDENMSIAKKAKQKVARKILLKYRLQLEQKAEATSEERDEEMLEKVNFLVKEIGELKAVTSRDATRREATRRDASRRGAD